MQVIISSRHFKVFKFMKQDIVHSIDKFKNRGWNINKAEIVLNKVHNKFHVEILIKGKGIYMEAKAEEDALSSAYIRAYDKAWRQMSKLMGKRKNHRAIHLAYLEIMAMEESYNDEFEFEVSASICQIWECNWDVRGKGKAPDSLTRR